ncbi:MAG: S-layer homology domain-containing protein [Clostridiales bacterium]|jgi:hypothetical protein|nr:S-layer homology domain-containing protein [Clostridiales bacterium]
MKLKRALAGVIAFAMLLSLVTITGVAAESGDGTPGNPLRIGTESELLAFASRVTAAVNGDEALHAILTADITTAESWTAIGKSPETYADSESPYVGTFDGDGHTLDLKSSSGSFKALFHTIGTDGVVKNLNLTVNFSGGAYLAGVAVRNYGTIDYVTVDGLIEANAAAAYAAGIAVFNGCKTINGVVIPGKILHCVNKANIDNSYLWPTTAQKGLKYGGRPVGGICADFLGEMRWCANLGEVWIAATSSGPSGGSLFAIRTGLKTNEPEQLLIVSDCYNAGNVYIISQLTPGVTYGGLFGVYNEMAIMGWLGSNAIKISNTFNYGLIRNPNADANKNNINGTHTIIGFGNFTDFNDSHVYAIFSNIYYSPEIGGTLFGNSPSNGADYFGTDLVKTIIHSKTTEEFASAELAAALNVDRTGTDAPWEYVTGNDYPTLKFERTDYSPDDDVYIPETPKIDITVAAGYGGTIELDEDNGTIVITANDEYKIDVVYIDGVPATAAQAVPTEGSELFGAAGATIDVSSGFENVKSVIATFAYTVNFLDPASGALSVSRGNSDLTSGSVVRAGEILLITYTGIGKIATDGLEQIDGTDSYKVVASRDNPPSISVEVDKAALAKAIDEAESETETGFTPDSWADLLIALTAAQIVNADAFATQTDVDDATSALESAIQALIPSADKTALDAAVDLANEKLETDYTPDSWADLQTALTEAQSVIADGNATQTDVDDATTELEGAINALIKRADKTALDAAAEVAKALIQADYTEDSWLLLADALINAKSVLADGNATEEQVKDALTALTDAVAQLEELEISNPADKTALIATVDLANEKDETDYTPDSWADLQTALTSAQSLIVDDSATQAEVDITTVVLESAINALVPRADKTELETAIATALALTEEDYTEESWLAVANALIEAQRALADENATSAEVSDAVAAINSAIAGLVEPTPPTPPELVDKTELEAAIATALALTEEDYTEESWLLLANALIEAQGVLADDNATSAEVSDAVAAINNAIAGLVEPTPPTLPELVDKTELEAAIATAIALVPGDFTEESWLSLANALDIAQSALASEDATQAEVDEAAESLTAAKDALVARSNGSQSGSDAPAIPYYAPPIAPAPSAAPTPLATPGMQVPLRVAGTVPVEIDGLTVDENGKITVEVKSEAVINALKSATKVVESAKAKGETNVAAEIKFNIAAPQGQTATGAEVDIPAVALKAVAKAGEVELAIASDNAAITFDSQALAGLVSGARDDDSIRIIITDVAKTAELNAKQLEKVGNNPAIGLSVMIGNRAVPDYSVTAAVKIPVSLANAFDSDLLSVYHIDENGSISEMKGSKYDAARHSISFATGRFSKFFVSEWISPFEDISKSDWFYKSIRFAYSNGLIAGTEPNRFSPETNLTRAMLVTILWRREGIAATESLSGFDDVESGQWYSSAIAWASANGIVGGIGGNKFAPNSDVTREQTVTMLYNYAKYKKLKAASFADISAYSDAGSVSAWAADAVQWANAAGILAGTTPTTLAPKGVATRAQASALLQRFIENIETE